MHHAANLIIPHPKPLKGAGKQRAVLRLGGKKKKKILFVEDQGFCSKPLWLSRGWVVIWGQNVGTACRGVHLHVPPEFPFCCRRAFRSVGFGFCLFFFFAICWQTLKCQAWGRFPSLIPFQPCGGGGEGRGQL